jgi:DNA-directed RNA polymerase subunit RPC12/RpoP
MPIPVTCDGCGARFKAPDAAAGKKGKCPKCGGRIIVPAPAPAAVEAAPMDDDMYDLAGGDAPPMPAPSPLPPTPPPYNPPRSTSTVSSSAISRGVVPKSASAGDWKKSNNPPGIMKVLAVIAAASSSSSASFSPPVRFWMMMSDKTGKTIRFKGVFIGVGLIVTGITTIAKAFSKGE